MRAFVLSSLAATGLAFSAVAMADPAAEAAPEKAAEEAKPEEAAVDCATLEGDAKTDCEAKATEAAEEPEAEAAEPAAKGGKAKRSSANRMESETEDE